MMQKQEASIETHDEHNQSFMILIVINKMSFYSITKSNKVQN